MSEYTVKAKCDSTGKPCCYLVITPKGDVLQFSHGGGHHYFDGVWADEDVANDLCAALNLGHKQKKTKVEEKPQEQPKPKHEYKPKVDEVKKDERVQG